MILHLSTTLLLAAGAPLVSPVGPAMSLVVPSIAQSADEWQAEEVTWDELFERGYDAQWRLPRRPPRSRRGVRPAVDLPAEMKQLAALRFDVPAGGNVVGPLPASALRSFGDLVAAFGVARNEPAAVEALLDHLRATRPDVWGRVGDWLPDLVRDGRLSRRDWSPAEEADDDGLLLAGSWDAASTALLPWREVDGDCDVFQAAALIFAGPDDVLNVANDYPSYRRNIGGDYEDIHPVPGTHLKGVDARGSPFTSLVVHIRCTLPFPFGSYSGDLWTLNTLDADGYPQIEVHSSSPDFHWMSSRTVLIPVVDADGGWVATLAVRQQGFDLDGVPDGDDDRRSALRGQLGNVKRNAEARAERLGPGRDAPVAGELPAFEVRG